MDWNKIKYSKSKINAAHSQKYRKQKDKPSIQLSFARIMVISAIRIFETGPARAVMAIPAFWLTLSK